MRDEYEYDHISNHWVQKDRNERVVLEKGVLIRYRMSRIKYMNNDFVS